eukprot:COSAG01_NODE_3435_length_6099_cov_11.954500_8_plen_250_part_00
MPLELPVRQQRKECSACPDPPRAPPWLRGVSQANRGAGRWWWCSAADADGPPRHPLLPCHYDQTLPEGTRVTRTARPGCCASPPLSRPVARQCFSPAHQRDFRGRRVGDGTGHTRGRRGPSAPRLRASPPSRAAAAAGCAPGARAGAVAAVAVVAPPHCRCHHGSPVAAPLTRTWRRRLRGRPRRVASARCAHGENPGYSSCYRSLLYCGALGLHCGAGWLAADAFDAAWQLPAGIGSMGGREPRWSRG